jgi:hypothetical protein
VRARARARANRAVDAGCRLFSSLLGSILASIANCDDPRDASPSLTSPPLVVHRIRSPPKRAMTFQIFVGGQRVNSDHITSTPAWSDAQVRSVVVDMRRERTTEETLARSFYPSSLPARATKRRRGR